MDIGQYNDLKILRFTSVGAYLGDEEGNEVLLPNKYLNPDWEEDDEVCIFLYKDSEDRPVATTEDPLITLNGFAYLTIKSVDFFGAFADWGLEKDLLIPFKEQRGKLEEGKRYLVHLRLDDKTDRLFGTTKTNKYLQPCEDEAIMNEKVRLLVCDKTDLGTKVIVNDQYAGLIFSSNMVRDLKTGDKTIGYVQTVRKDGKLDIILAPDGYEKISDYADLILNALKINNPLLHNDKSDPEEIRSHYGMSKKSFKQAIGKLLKDKKITINEDKQVYLA